MVSMRRCTLTQFTQGRSEPDCQFLCWASAPVVQENHQWLFLGHVVMNCDHVEAILPQRLKNRSHFVFKHGYVARNGGVLLRTDKCRPRVEAHTGIDDGSVIFQYQVIATHCDLENSRLTLEEAAAGGDAVPYRGLSPFGGVRVQRYQWALAGQDHWGRKERYIIEIAGNRLYGESRASSLSQQQELLSNL